MSNRTTILMLSGGLDSTACLLKLLTETKDDVHTFYVDLDNNEYKAWCEKEAIDRLIKECESTKGKKDTSSPDSLRSFTHHTGSKFEIHGTCERGLQPYLWMTSASLMLNKIEGKGKRLCIGYTHGDSATENLDMIKDQWEKIWGMISDPNKRPPLYLPLVKRTKAQSMDYIRRIEHQYNIQVINKLWTCEFPQRVVGPDFSGYRACKDCLPCQRGLEIGFVQP